MTAYRSIDEETKVCSVCQNFRRYSGYTYGECVCFNSDHYKHIISMGHLSCSFFEKDKAYGN